MKRLNHCILKLLCFVLCLCLLPSMALTEGEATQSYTVSGFSYRVWNSWTCENGEGNIVYYYKDPSDAAMGMLMVSSSETGSEYADDDAEALLFLDDLTDAMDQQDSHVNYTDREALYLNGRPGMLFIGDIVLFGDMVIGRQIGYAIVLSEETVVFILTLPADTDESPRDMMMTILDADAKALEDSAPNVEAAQANTSATEVDDAAVKVDYPTAEAFEADLNAGIDCVGKVVSFEVLAVKPDSALGFNLWSGEHLNFVSYDPVDVKEGDLLTVRVTKVNQVLKSWRIQYEIVEDEGAAVPLSTAASQPDAAPAPTDSPYESDGDWLYSLASDDTVVITGYSGNETALIIPAELQGKPVTGIGEKAFAQSRVTRLQLPDTLTEIGDLAFYKSGLERVNLPDALTHIGEGAFAGCSPEFSLAGKHPHYSVLKKGLYHKDSRTLIAALEGIEEVPEGIDAIGKYAFYRMKHLPMTLLPDTVTRIDDYAFYGASFDGGLSLPNDLASIGEYAFAEATCQSVRGGNSIGFGFGFSSSYVEQKKSAASASKSEKEQIKDEMVKQTEEAQGRLRSSGGGSAREYTHYDYSTVFRLPKSLTELNGHAFERFSMPEPALSDNKILHPSAVFSIKLTSLSEISEYAFNESAIPNEGMIELPSVTSVGEYAFCHVAGDVTLPKTVKTVGDYAFAGSGAADLGQVERIGEHSFDGRSVEALPDTLTAIGSGAFETSPIQFLSLPANLTSIGERAFPADVTLFIEDNAYALDWAQANGYWVERSAAEEEEEDMDWLEEAMDEPVYQEALAFEDAGEYDKAIEAYNKVIDYRDSRERITVCEAAKVIYRSAKDLIPETSMWGASGVALQKALRNGPAAGGDEAAGSGTVEFVRIGRNNGLRVREIPFRDYSLDAYYTLGENMGSCYGLSKVTYILSGTQKRDNDALIQDYHAFVDLFKEVLGDWEESSDKVTSWQADGSSVRIGIAKVANLNGSANKNLAIVIGATDIPKPAYATGTYNRSISGVTKLGAFSEGLAGVATEEKVGYIDTEGELVIPIDYNLGVASGFSFFHEGYVYVNDGGKYGYIDKTGAEVIPFQYEGASNFSGGLAAVEQNGKYGFIDANGDTVLPFRWDYAESFHHGLAAVKEDGLWGFIDPQGAYVIPPQWESLFSSFALYYQFEEPLAMVNKGDRKTWYLIDQKGAVAATYDHYPEESERLKREYQDTGLYPIKKGDNYGYADSRGNVVIPCQWSYVASGFVDGFARVVVKRENKRNAQGAILSEYGYIDVNGREVFPCIYDDAEYSEGHFILLKDGEVTIVSADEITAG